MPEIFQEDMLAELLVTDFIQAMFIMLGMFQGVILQGLLLVNFLNLMVVAPMVVHAII